MKEKFQTTKNCADAGTIPLRYPVLFVHGAGFRDKIMGCIDYWGRIPAHLARQGVRCYYGGTDAWGSIESNAAILQSRVQDILRITGASRVNIIAHSRGGLESRYLISSLGMAEKIASLTTISTPHHGVKAVNIALHFPESIYRLTAFFVDLWSRMSGDKAPDFWTSSRQLSPAHAVAFNRSNPDSSAVYYQSFAAKMQHWFSDPTFMLMYPLIRLTDGDNDGLCPIESAKWGDYKGVITSQGAFGISHGGVIDSHKVKYKGADIIALYISIVTELAAKGF
ncbi:MAG: hypothetical protein Ta2A_00410 [Treponemataceae bacterium]|nr:MAG: hypothetical protein Ta2A_00410 [Treponemataceae bacterium]